MIHKISAVTFVHPGGGGGGYENGGRNLTFATKFTLESALIGGNKTATATNKNAGSNNNTAFKAPHGGTKQETSTKYHKKVSEALTCASLANASRAIAWKAASTFTASLAETCNHLPRIQSQLQEARSLRRGPTS